MRRAVVLIFLLGTVAAARAGVLDTRHNLSITGPGPVTSTTEDEVCVFCHAAHVEDGGSTLWNHETSSAVTYEPYQSTTMSAVVGQPNGVSRLCLSCHDGTIAVGSLVGQREPIQMRGTGAGARLKADSPANLGRDLSGAHPVSMDYSDAARRRRSVGATFLHSAPTSPDGAALLDRAGRVQCTSCHDPHEDPAMAGLDVPPFWRGTTFSEVCTACHDAPLVETGHDNPALLTKGCGSCHVGHGAPLQPLLPFPEEESCFTCHGPPSARRDAQTAGKLSPTAQVTRVDDLFARPYNHPVAQSRDIHQPGENLDTDGARTRRHVECVDCHPTHGSGGIARPGIAPRGIRATAERAGTEEYEKCLDCHGQVTNLPFGQTNKAAEIDPANESYHPVVAPARGQSESLKRPWVSGDQMTCSDCHGPDGEDVRRGPHGSRNPWILRGAYIARDGAPESEDAYEACYDCHSRGVILGDTTFEGHSDHVLGASISCYACHDSHGSTQYPGLIRFGKDIRIGQVLPSGSGRFEYDSELGECYLSCHGVDHDPLGYR